MEQVYFAAGCFWGVEVAFRRVTGVAEVEVGYTGGHTEHPSYEAVCTGRTGHAEAVRVVYDPGQVGFDELLEVFWSVHNPTHYHRQGPDVGSQYRSAIFFTTEDQAERARASAQALEASGRYSDPVVTEIQPAGPFYRAEEYHQRYLEKRGRV
jgi:peptide-methionine (S)-S-oxide reductase